MKKILTNPSGDKAYFDEPSHTYICPETGNAYRGVTTTIKSFFPKFDEQAVAAKVSKKTGQSITEILAAWAKKRDDASLFGKKIHLTVELYLGGASFKDACIKAEISTERELSHAKAARKYIDELLGRYDFVASEMIVFSKKLNLAGTIDAVFRSKQNGKIALFDWKTNQKIEASNRFQKGLEPIVHLDDCNFNHYSLQLAAYETILKSEPYLVGVEGDIEKKLVHLTDVNTQFPWPLKEAFANEIPTKDVCQEISLVVGTNPKAKAA